MVNICKRCAFNNTDCVLKPRVRKAGGRKCRLHAPKAGKRAPEDKPSRTSWPTSAGKLFVKICYPDGRILTRMVKMKKPKKK